MQQQTIIVNAVGDICISAALDTRHRAIAHLAFITEIII